MYRSYLALDSRLAVTRVPSRTGIDAKNIRFKLERVPLGNLSKNSGFFAPDLGSKLPPELKPTVEGEDPEFDFEFEFQPVPDSEQPEVAE